MALTRSDALRATLARSLPPRLRQLMAGYESFAAEAPAAEDAKTFAAHHAACKAALQHADMLVKLLRWAEGGAGEAEGQAAGDDVSALLARARAAIEEDEGEGDED